VARTDLALALAPLLATGRAAGALLGARDAGTLDARPASALEASVGAASDAAFAAAAEARLRAAALLVGAGDALALRGVVELGAVGGALASGARFFAGTGGTPSRAARARAAPEPVPAPPAAGVLRADACAGAADPAAARFRRSARRSASHLRQRIRVDVTSVASVEGVKVALHFSQVAIANLSWTFGTQLGGRGPGAFPSSRLDASNISWKPT
jgi:hypothetical protein